MPLAREPIERLEPLDERSFSHVGLYADLKAVVRGARVSFLVPPRGEIAWQRALFLNLAYWQEGEGDVLPARAIPADAIMHAAWHLLAARFVAPSVEAHLLGESIASAFDLYLVGRLLGKSPESEFLQSQVPQMAAAAEAAGLEADAFESLLEDAAAEPERAFEDLRALLFDAAVTLERACSPEEGARALERLDGHRYAPLLFHFELVTWVLRAALERARGQLGDGGEAARAADRALRAARDPVAWLDEHWVQPALARSEGEAPRA
jgi:hypothetical protein